MYELNKTINWKPKSTGEGRFGNWLKNANDWNLSRSRYWGTPLPIWRTEDGLEEMIIGSVEELKSEMQKSVTKGYMGKDIFSDFVVGDMSEENYDKIDLHKNIVDQITLVSPSGKPMKRESDLIDVWFDSGAMPYAQWHYPFENQAEFEQNFPADFIAEGVDQTRGWFFTMHAIATMVFDSVAFKTVVSNGLVMDKNGQKMSKRLGNTVEPFKTIATYGADATRWYMISNAQPWENLKFNESGIAEIQRKLFGTVYNTYAFFALYANIDGYSIVDKGISPIGDRPEIDRWIMSKLHSLIGTYRAYMDDYEPTQACRAVESFVNDHLSNWYVRLNRRRFWKGEMSDNKRMAYDTLFECLMVTSQLMAPVAPFFAEWLYKNISDGVRSYARANNFGEGHISVHLTDLALADTSLIHTDLEQRMDYAQRISSLVLSLRKKEKLRVRQPLQRIMLPVLNDAFQKHVEDVRELILSEVNIKEIEFITDTAGLLSKKAKPNFKTLGRRLGKQMKAAVEIISSLDQEAIAEIEKSNQFNLELDGEVFELTMEDFEIVTEDIPGWQVATDGPLVVALDMTLTDELIAEGYARDLVNRIQNLRKQKNFNVTDRIHITVGITQDIENAIAGFSEYIRGETLADSLELATEVDGEEVEWIDGSRVVIDIRRR